MASHPTGTIKQDPVTKAAAVRSSYDETSQLAWMVGDPSNGGHWATDEMVADWPTLPGTPVADPAPEVPDTVETEDFDA